MICRSNFDPTMLVKVGDAPPIAVAHLATSKAINGFSFWPVSVACAGVTTSLSLTVINHVCYLRATGMRDHRGSEGRLMMR